MAKLRLRATACIRIKKIHQTLRLRFGYPGSSPSVWRFVQGDCAVPRCYDVIFTSQSQLGGQIHAARATGSIERQLRD